MSGRVLVVGGGLTGLAVGAELTLRGSEVTVLEASARAGGVLATVARGGYLLESGPNSYVGGAPTTEAWISKLGLRDRVRAASSTASSRWVFLRGAARPLPSSPWTLLRSGVLSPVGASRALAEPLLARRPRAAALAGSEDESVRAFFARRFGAEVADGLADAMQQGLWAGDPRRLSLEAAFPRLHALAREHRSLLVGLVRSRSAAPAGPPPAPGSRHGHPTQTAGGISRGGGRIPTTFVGGMEELTRALVETLGDDLRLDARVESLEYVAEPVRPSADAARWRVRLEGGETLEGAHVVLALPAPEAATLLSPLASEASALLRQVRYAPIAVVHLGFAPGALRPAPPEGFGLLVPTSARRPLLGVIFASSTFPHRAPPGHTLLTCLLGGMTAPDVIERSPSDLVALARSELAAISAFGGHGGLEGEPELTGVVHHRRAIPQYELGHRNRLERLEQATAGLQGLRLCGSAHRGPSIEGCLEDAERCVGSL